MKYCRTIIFILRNVYTFFKLKKIQIAVVSESIMVLPLSHNYVNDVLNIYSKFSGGNMLPLEKKLVLSLCGSKLVFILYDTLYKKVVGCEFYYFNKRDIRDHTIHQGFRGILPEYQGKGFGTLLTSHAYTTYSDTWLKGISSRVSCNNMPSLISNQKIGFTPVEKYFDADMGEDRYYMICNFKSKEKYV